MAKIIIKKIDVKGCERERRKGKLVSFFVSFLVLLLPTDLDGLVFCFLTRQNKQIGLFFYVSIEVGR